MQGCNFGEEAYAPRRHGASRRLLERMEWEVRECMEQEEEVIDWSLINPQQKHNDSLSKHRQYLKIIHSTFLCPMSSSTSHVHRPVTRILSMTRVHLR